MASKGIDYYIREKEKNQKESLSFKRDISLISYLRFAVFVIGLFMSIFTSYIEKYEISGLISVLWIGLFVYLIKLHEGVIGKKKLADALLEINERGIKRVNGGWNNFQEDGSEYFEEEHPYSGDLDIIGHSSLYQWINSCSTFMGTKALKDYILRPLKTVEAIKRRQEAVGELSKEIAWRQRINAEGMLISEKSKNPDELLQWAETIEEDKNDLSFSILSNLFTFAIFSVLFLVLILKKLPWQYILGAIAVNIAVLMLGSKRRNASLDLLHKHKNGIKIYEKIIKAIEDKNLKSHSLNELQSKFIVEKNIRASAVIGELKTISDLISDRSNMAYIIIDILFMWDFRVELMLKRWKRNYGRHFRAWLNTIGELEALSSLSNIAFENESWCFPDITTEGIVVKAEALGHPLLGGRRVCNDITIRDKGSVVLITGSNMAGKSTFLRTVGINLIMGYCGAPVCASKFSAVIMDVYTCMRVSDNLEKSISSFYAEILRIKSIVQATKVNSRIFFLLDEIFKGTNSLDRHQGAKVLIKQLSAKGASGMVSTHDLELGEMEKEYSKVSNYHFEEHYKNGQLSFDYKLKKGVSTTRNAMHIIKLAGIELD